MLTVLKKVNKASLIKYKINDHKQVSINLRQTKLDSFII